MNVVLMSAIQKGASDIHIEPYEKELRVRYRIDGILYNIMSPPMKFRDAIIVAHQDHVEARHRGEAAPAGRPHQDPLQRERPAEGNRLPRLGASRRSSARRSSCVSSISEKLMLDMTKLGFESESLVKFETAIPTSVGHGPRHRPDRQRQDEHALLVDQRSINTPETNIMTAEDPVEFNLAGINQVQVRENIGLNFAAALRSFLRQDPNIILVGEIRDFETAEIAIKAALTGHLVLSTLHTNDAPSTINRLMNMGIEPFLVASSVHLICAQRLVRRICSQLLGATSRRRPKHWCRPASRTTTRTLSCQ
ncbi:MAG: ATPase, T2SS/T4P/T4SS family [Vicinamibacterales bacterium]